MTNSIRDRYVSFTGLDCDANAAVLMQRLKRRLTDPTTAQQWRAYFEGKLKEQERMGVDDLFFVGSQVNTLYALFEACGDQEACDMLYQVEQECC